MKFLCEFDANNFSEGALRRHQQRAAFPRPVIDEGIFRDIPRHIFHKKRQCAVRGRLVMMGVRFSAPKAQAVEASIPAKRRSCIYTVAAITQPVCQLENEIAEIYPG